MPLTPGKTKAALSSNIAKMIHEGRPKDQAVAIAYHNAGAAKADPTRHLIGRRGKRGGIPAYIVHSDGKYGRAK